MGTPETRKAPNILITGTPGTGKTTLAEKLAQKLVSGFDFISCGRLITEHKLHCGYDGELETYILDEDRLLDHIERRMDDLRGRCIVEYHGAELFPQRWFDFVFVLRCNNTVLYDRLAARNYSDKKIRTNIECEIFEVLLEEARESYDVSTACVFSSKFQFFFFFFFFNKSSKHILGIGLERWFEHQKGTLTTIEI
ncbi:unnamed protein product [Gongylonema pulchrum]|uniref:Adenylate kinase isoenzyme 6 homolog n=1 Tax=Gongylonema pulchrum TaxID=637853 RepID=A0A183DS15_9BILA|nr:unnamed protein product [Gongylonema pulchrum]